MTNLIILDASGSMGSKTDEVKGGLKQLFKSIREDYEKAEVKIVPRVIVIDFSNSNDIRTIIDTTDLERLVDSVADNYRTRGMTALYDAIGKGIQAIDKEEKDVFINVITDGEENDSKEFKGSDIKKLVEDGKAKGWAVTFMGTTEASLNQASSIGISRGNMGRFADSKKGVKFSMEKVMNVRSTYYGASASLGERKAKLDVDNLMANDKTEE